MKTSLFLVLPVMAIVLACGQKVEIHQEVSAEPESPKYDQLPLERMDSLYTINEQHISGTAGLSACDPKHRQILLVKEFAVVNGLEYTPQNNKTKAARSVMLVGKNSPSSCKLLTHAFLTFLPEGQVLNRPSYKYVIVKGDTIRSEIRLSFPESYFDGILYKLQNNIETYCWYGEFKDGYLYGDVEIGHSY